MRWAWRLETAATRSTCTSLWFSFGGYIVEENLTFAVQNDEVEFDLLAAPDLGVGPVHFVPLAVCHQVFLK